MRVPSARVCRRSSSSRRSAPLSKTSCARSCSIPPRRGARALSARQTRPDGRYCRRSSSSIRSMWRARLASVSVRSPATMMCAAAYRCWSSASSPLCHRRRSARPTSAQAARTIPRCRVRKARALAGIGCHWMALWVPDFKNEPSTQMGGEGANWIGQAPFTHSEHIFQNLGDGTYYHSGSLGDPRGDRRQGKHHLQAALQRCGRDDGRSAGRGSADGRA